MNRKNYIEFFNKSKVEGNDYLKDLNTEEFTGYIFKTYENNELNALLLTYNSDKFHYLNKDFDYFNQVKENIVKVLALEYLDTFALKDKSSALIDVVKISGYEDEFLDLLSNINCSLYYKKIRELNMYFEKCTFNKSFSFKSYKKRNKVSNL